MNNKSVRESKFEKFLKRIFITIGVLFAFTFFNLWYNGNLGVISVFLKNPKLQVFTIVLSAILLEAFPFILLGAIISGIIEVYVSEEKLEKLFPKNKFLSSVIGSFLGMFFPVCSCGNVPVGRRLLSKGINKTGGISYMLSSPIINPITILSTAIAFSYSKEMVLGRIFFTFISVLIISFILGFTKGEILKQDYTKASCEIHHHDFSKLEQIFHHAENDFLVMGRYLVLGATIAALFQTFVSRQVFLSLASNKILSVLLMQVLGISLSLCSFADAFVASSFTHLPSVSKIVFMVAGPITNISLMILYSGTFTKKFTLKLIISAFITIFLLGIISIQFFGG